MRRLSEQNEIDPDQAVFTKRRDQQAGGVVCAYFPLGPKTATHHKLICYCSVSLVSASAKLLYISFMLLDVKSVNNSSIAALNEFDVKFAHTEQ